MSEDPRLDLEGHVARLADEDPLVRCVAAKELGRAGRAAVDAVPALTGGLDDPDPMVRSLCAAALGKVGSAASAAIGHLVRMLGDPVVPVRFWAADALGRIGDLPSTARTALERLMADDDPEAAPARLAARRALARMGTPPDPGP